MKSTRHSSVEPTKPFEFENDAIQVDAAIVAAGFGMAPERFLERLREGKVTSRCEKGVDADAGRYRLTFFFENRRLRVVVDESGTILQRSVIDFGDRPLPRRRTAGVP